MGHPAHVHFFKNFIWLMEKKGHEFKITARDKEITLYLLDKYGFNYVNRGKIVEGIHNKAIEMFKIDYKLYKIVKVFNPDILMGIHNPYIAHVGKILGKKVFIFTDTEHGKIANSITFPFATKIFTPNCFNLKLGSSKHIPYNGYHELAYLHPNYFTPNDSILGDLNLGKDDKFFIMRFVGWHGTHDYGKCGFSLEMKREIIRELEDYGDVFISSESKLPIDFEKYRIPVKPEKIHSALYYASMLICEGNTMASESAILGTPSIRLSPYGDRKDVGYLEELENKYNLVHSFRNENEVFEKVKELISIGNIKNEVIRERENMLGDKVDVTMFMVDYVEKQTNS